MKKKYIKPPLNIDEQLSLLKSRNIIIDNKDIQVINNFLSFNNYYRIAPYWKISNCKNHIQDKINFIKIINRYEFDHSLRVLLIENLKIIEIALKTKFAYIFSLKYKDSHFYVNKDLFKDFTIKENIITIEDVLSKIKEEINKNKSNFICHYKNNYNEEVPPAWVMTEIITFGTMTMFIKCLKNNEDLKLFTNEFNINHMILKDWINSFVKLRNICSHHSVLFNQNLPINIKTKAYKRSKNIKLKNYLEDNKKIYNSLLMILHFFKESNIKNNFKNDLIKLLLKIEDSDLISFYGFNKDYKIVFNKF